MPGRVLLECGPKSETLHPPRGKLSSPGFQDDFGEGNFRARAAPYFLEEFFNFAPPLFFVVLGHRRLDDPERMSVIRDLHGLAGAGHALDLERFADQGAERYGLQAVRQYRLTEATSILRQQFCP